MAIFVPNKRTKLDMVVTIVVPALKSLRNHSVDPSQSYIARSCLKITNKEIRKTMFFCYSDSTFISPANFSLTTTADSFKWPEIIK